MYLSKVELTAPWTRDPYSWHRGLWQLFPGRPDAARTFLFRNEAGVQGGRLQVLLQSSDAPVASADGANVLAMKTFAPVLKEGQWLRFHLTANPVKTIKDREGRQDKRGEPKSCRVPLIRAEQQEEWLRRKLDGAAKLHVVEIATREPLYFRRKGDIGKIVPVRFEGILIVQNRERFLDLVRQGIGPAKAFGCGLLSLAPA
jgi:CRISPR system Cascade subunit CasE